MSGNNAVFSHISFDSTKAHAFAPGFALAKMKAVQTRQAAISHISHA
jgi:hypothetical protein